MGRAVSDLPPSWEIQRVLKDARKGGMSVDRMGLVVENGRITLLPPSNDTASVSAGAGGDWDKRLAAK